MQWSEQLCYAQSCTPSLPYILLWGGFLDSVTCCTWVIMVEGVGIMQDSPSPPCSCLHAEDAGYAFIQPACAPLLFNGLSWIWLLLVQQWSTPPASCIASWKMRARIHGAWYSYICINNLKKWTQIIVKRLPWGMLCKPLVFWFAVHVSGISTDQFY